MEIKQSLNVHCLIAFIIGNAMDIAVNAGNKTLEVVSFICMDKENDLVIFKAKVKELPAVVNNEDLVPCNPF